MRHGWLTGCVAASLAVAIGGAVLVRDQLPGPSTDRLPGAVQAAIRPGATGPAATGPGATGPGATGPTRQPAGTPTGHPGQPADRSTVDRPTDHPPVDRPPNAGTGAGKPTGKPGAEPPRIALAVGAVPVTGLYPGATHQLPVVVGNPYPFPIVVTDVVGTLVSTSDPRCAVSDRNLRVGELWRSTPEQSTVAGGQRAGTGHLTVRMPATVADACQGVTFTVHLTASAGRAKT